MPVADMIASAMIRINLIGVSSSICQGCSCVLWLKMDCTTARLKPNSSTVADPVTIAVHKEIKP